ncbi:hypothetical protein C8R46DRAFT_1048221 [Mycena filopes]|nr:hypothetical protein C8R46DRAFT_1048221 [Mycena filopes]
MTQPGIEPEMPAATQSNIEINAGTSKKIIRANLMTQPGIKPGLKTRCMLQRTIQKLRWMRDLSPPGLFHLCLQPQSTQTKELQAARGGRTQGAHTKNHLEKWIMTQPGIEPGLNDRQIPKINAMKSMRPGVEPGLNTRRPMRKGEAATGRGGRTQGTQAVGAAKTWRLLDNDPAWNRTRIEDLPSNKDQRDEVNAGARPLATESLSLHPHLQAE